MREEPKIGEDDPSSSGRSFMAGARQIEEAMRKAGIGGLPDGVVDRLAAYLALLLRWNARLNLTSVRVPEEIVRRHFVESAFAAQHLPQGIRTLLDFGSGAGFPGIPIALCHPEIRVTLSESQSKKAAFLREAVRTLGLESEVHPGRVEDLSPDRTFDAVVLRAVDRMEEAIGHARTRTRYALALLTTEADAERYRELAPEFRWNEALRLPQTKQAVLLVGQCESVPRGT